MENIRLTKSEEGHWLEFFTNAGNKASLLIESIKRGPIVTETINQWAKEEIERSEK